MSEHDSTTPTTSGKSIKPDPALQLPTTARAKTAKPAKASKPYPEYPLTPHPAGYWCKRIRGKLHYFGRLDDPDGALTKYNEQKAALHAGHTPRPAPESLTVKQLANHYLEKRQPDVEAGTLSLRTWRDYRAIMRMLIQGFSKGKLVSTLTPQDFGDLKKKLAKRNGPARMSTVVQVIRSAFKFAMDDELIDTAVRFGPAFKRTSKKTLRIDRGKKGAKLFTAEEIRQLLGYPPWAPAAGIQVQAMILLGINAGYGNNDCGMLRISSIDFERGAIDFARPKTGIPRRCVLWPETVAALKEVLATRPKPNDSADADLAFITKYGQAWAKDTNSGPLVNEMRKLLGKLGINGRARLGFYTLRHTFRTIADEARDQPAADYIMGHESTHMSTVYRETISDARLKDVTEYVRVWLFPSAGKNDRLAKNLEMGQPKKSVQPTADQ